MPCECCSCCVIDAVAYYGKTEATCGVCVQYNKRPPEETTEASCESTYDGCLISSEYTEIDGAVLEFTESDCASGSPSGTADCGLFIETNDPTSCPEGWFYGPIPGSPGATGCYTYRCVSDCEECAYSGASVTGCSEGAYACVSTNSFTKHYGTWTAGVWYVSCVDYLSPQALAIGPGTELKSLLATFGIHATPNCKCNKMAKKMNAWGPDGCLEHMEEIVDVMQEEAGKRGLPFLRSLGRLLVKKAIRRARGQ